MIKVTILFTDKSKTEFYPVETGAECNGGRAIYWNLDEKTLITYNLSSIIFVKEEEYE